VAVGGFFTTAILIFIIPNVASVAGAMALMAVASFSSDLTMPISWNTCVEIGKEYTATVSSTMNMLGNFAGFVAPVVFGFILQYTQANYAIVMYTMAVAAIVSGGCWLFLEPDAQR
jgi:nitrate/nitrite transporter NarK